MIILDVTETAKSDSKNIRLLANTFPWQLFNQWVPGFIPQIILNFETQHDLQTECTLKLNLNSRLIFPTEFNC